MEALRKRPDAAGVHRTPLRAIWRRCPRVLRAAAVRVVQDLSRPAAANRRLAILLLGFIVLWTISAEIRNLAVPLPSDMAESFALSREWAIGYVKHPPLLNWITAAWFAVMPIAPWSFHLLAMLNAALALALAWLAAGCVSDPRRRIMAVALLVLTPIYTFHAANFNHNAISLTLWPLVVLSFFASIGRANLLWSVLFGAASGLAILGKYYAGLIVLACVVAALLHPDRRSYLRSPRPYLAAASCALVLAPHLYWLLSNDFVSIAYHLALERSIGPIAVLVSSLSCAAAYVAYLSLALLVLWLCLRPWTSAMAHSLVADWPAKRRIIASIAFLPGIAPILLMPLAGIAVHSPWTFPAYFFVPLAIVSAPRLLVTCRAAAASVGAAMLFSALVLAVSPILALGNFLLAKPDQAAPYIALARIATDTWHSRMGGRLEFVTGTTYRAWYVTFYSPDHPGYSPTPTRIFSRAEIESGWNEHGVLGICGRSDFACAQWLAQALPRAERLDITLPNTFIGLRRPPESYILYLQPRALTGLMMSGLH
jgi:4-amino-4-deoxy-L-arabinose transferase-like glycosyltransferase